MAAIDDLTAAVAAEQPVIAKLAADIQTAINDLAASNPNNPAIAAAATAIQQATMQLQQSATNLEAALPAPTP